MGRRSRGQAPPVDENLEALVEDYAKRKRNLVGRGLAAGVAAGGAAATGQDVNSAVLRWLPQARDPEALSPSEAAQLKANILENMRLMAQAENDRKKPLHDIAKAQLQANNDLMKELSNLVGKDLSATGNVIASRNNALAKGRTAVETAITEAYNRRIEDPTAKNALKELRGVVTTRMADGSASPEDVLNSPEVQRALSQAVNATAQEPDARAAILNEIAAPFVVDGRTISDAQVALAQAASTSAFPTEMTQALELFDSQSIAEAESVRTAAEERVIARDEEYQKALAASIPVRYKPFLDALLEAQGAGMGERQDMLQRALQEVDGLEASDPALRQKMEDALDQLEQGSPQDLTLQAAKQELQQSRFFREYMAEVAQNAGISPDQIDPNMALRQLRKEIRDQNRQEKKATRRAFDMRAEQRSQIPVPTEGPTSMKPKDVVVPRGVNADVAEMLRQGTEDLEDK